MKIKIWTVTTNTDDGVQTQSFPTEALALGHRAEVIDAWWQEADLQEYDADDNEIEVSADDKYDALCERPDFVDSVHFEAHELDVPFPAYGVDIEAALCVNEWLENQYSSLPVGSWLYELFEAYGAGGMRMAAVQAGQIVLTVHDLMEAEGFDYVSAYDWEFVPAVLERLDWAKLLDNNQYGDHLWRPDPAPILYDMMAKMEYFQDTWLADAKREADKQWGYEGLVDDCAEEIDRTMKPADWIKAMGEDLDLTPKSTWMRGF